MKINDFIVFPKGIIVIPFGKSHNWADPEIPQDFDLKINISPRLGGVERKTFFIEIVNIPILSHETLRNNIFATVFEKSADCVIQKRKEKKYFHTIPV